MQIRASLSNAGHHIQVIVKFQPGMQTTDDMHFRSAGVGGFFGDRDNLFDGHLIRTFFAALAIKGTEFAIQRTDIGVINMAIAIVKCFIAMHFLAHEIRHAPQPMQIARLIQDHAVIM